MNINLGQITSPAGGANMTVLPGSNVTIPWLFNDTISGVSYREWRFTSSDGSFVGKPLASISDDGMPDIKDSGLSGVAILKPATLLLKNVNQSYDGTYRFILVATEGGRSEVVVYIASK